MNVSIKQLNGEWKELRQELKEKRVKFDDEYRQKHQEHICSTKVYAHTGEWFCKHLTEARNREFKEQIAFEQKLVSSIINLAN